jgi:hypothetical protein
MYAFHATVHVRSAEAVPAGSIELSGRAYPTLAVPLAAQAEPFPVSFEEAAAPLAALARLFIEPDGSFVWVSASDAQPAWQIDGVLYDHDERLIYVELKGSCPAPELDQLLSAVGWPKAPVMFLLVREAVYVDEATFRQIVSSTRK